MESFRIGVDIGGTFTDIVFLGDKGTVLIKKVASTPQDYSNSVIQGISEGIKELNINSSDITEINHGFTVATNAILERKGAATGLITTQGFRDILIIGRQKRYETYDLHINKPEPLVQRRNITEVVERTDYDGSISTPLDITSLDKAVAKMLSSNLEAIAISLIHSYANPKHEKVIRDRILEKAPNLSVSISSEISPKFREYERTNTTVANAYVRPIVDRYITALETRLAERNFKNDLFVMQSSGGLVSAKIARDYPIRIIESGPAAGVLMGGIVGKNIGEEHVITFDMGGTTANLGAVDGDTPAITPTFEVGHIRYKKGSGLPINVPAVELLEIGAGGGSIAKIELGMIAIGPESAGADPGPICYGKGGTQPTITDANAVLGYISGDWFNAGEMQLDIKAARSGIFENIAKPLGLTLEPVSYTHLTLPTKA